MGRIELPVKRTREIENYYLYKQDYSVHMRIVILITTDMSPVVTVNKVLEEIDQLDPEDRNYVHQILSSRLIEAERSRIAKRALEAEEHYSHGHVRSGSVNDLFSELND